MKKTPVATLIQDLESRLDRYNFILKHFPDAKATTSGRYLQFVSKTVTQNYTCDDIQTGYQSVFSYRYCILEREVNGVTEKIKIFSEPKKSVLAYTGYDRKSQTSCIKFNRILNDYAKYSFKDETVLKIRKQIMDFITARPTFKIDDKNLDPKIKKMLIFA